MNIRNLSFYDREVLLVMVKGKSMSLDEIKDRLHYLQTYGVFSALNRAINAKPGSVVQSVRNLSNARLIYSLPGDAGRMNYLLSSVGYKLQQSK